MVSSDFSCLHYHMKQLEDSFPNLKVMPLASRKFYSKGQAHPPNPDNNTDHVGDQKSGGEFPEDEPINTEPMEDDNLPPDPARDNPILHDEAFEALLECYGPSLKEADLGQDGEGIHPQNIGPAPDPLRTEPT